MEGDDVWLAGAWKGAILESGGLSYCITVEFPPDLELHQRCWSFAIVSNQNWIDILVRMQEVSIR